MILTSAYLTKGKFFFPIITIIFLYSCVPNKKITYLQDKEVKEKLYPRDSIIKAYNDQYRLYKLQPLDIISVRIGSLTPSEFNFVKQYEEELGIIRRLNQYNQGQFASGLNQNLNQQNLSQTMPGMAGGNTLYLDRQNTGFILDDLGSLEMPKIGVVDLKGFNLDEAENKIKRMLEGYFETPIVRIQLLSFHFVILGEVTNEGRYTSFDPKTDIFDAIVMAGNLTEYADRSNIKIVRQVNNESMVIYINALDQKTLQAQNVYLYPGDMIIVPPLNARYWRKYVLPDTSTALAILTAVISIFLLIYTFKK